MNDNWTAIPISDVPMSRHRQHYGRSARLLAALLELRGQAMECAFTTENEARGVEKNIRRIAAKEDYPVQFSRQGSTLWMWIQGSKEGAA